jgi:hypothetical protein
MPPYQQGLFFPGLYTANQVLWFQTYIATGTITLTQGTWFAATSRTPFAVTKVFTVSKNGVSLATFTFAAGATTATISAISTTTLIASDTLTVIAPTVGDTTGGGVAVTFFGART